MLCAVLGCNNSNYKNKSNNTNKNIRFLGFPKDPKLCKQWVVFCGRLDNFNTNSSRICSDHFKIEDYNANVLLEQYGLPVRRRLKPNTVPSVILPFQQSRRLGQRRTIPQSCSSLSTVEPLYQQNFSYQVAHSLALSSVSLPPSRFKV